MTTMHSLRLGILAATIFTTAALAGPDVIYHDANIHTADADRPRASAVAIEDGRFTAVGSDAEVLALADGDTRLIDLNGLTVLPGLIDAHGHMGGLGQLYTDVIDLSGTSSYAEVIELVSAQAERQAPGAWIIGRGWDHESWPANAAGVRELPHHGPLSEAVPNNPVHLSRVDGHAALVNAAAMRIAGLTTITPAPEGGEIIRTNDGVPTGVLIDNAESLVTRYFPSNLYAEFDDLVLAAQRALLEVGITGVHDMGVSPAEVAVYERLVEQGSLVVRIDAMVSAPYAVRYFSENEPFAGDTLSVRGVKVYADGAMGSRGAWLLEPYTDRPIGTDGRPYTGLAVSDPSDIESIAHHALVRNYQVCAHAIGDRGNREVLDAFERAHARFAMSADPGTPTSPRPLGAPVRTLNHFRFRVEHAQLLHPDDLPRFAELGVIASMQPRHATSDMRWIADRVGPERTLGAYAWASLLQSGAVIASGSDFPVEPFNPFRGFYAAITRQDESGSPDGGWLAHERMTRTEALRSFTLDAAFAAFHEDSRGSITPGKLADLIVTDRDIMTVAPADILDTRVLRTLVGGREVYAADAD